MVTDLSGINQIDAIATRPFNTLAMLAAAELDIFSHTRSRQSAESLAAKLGLKQDRLQILLWSLVTEGLLHHEGPEGFVNSAVAGRFLDRGSPDYIATRLDMYRTQLDAVSRTSETLRKGRPKAKKDFTAMSDEDFREYYAGTHPATVACAKRLQSRLDFSGVRMLIDCGGGSGGLATTLVAANPGMSAVVLDLPRVIDRVTQPMLAPEDCSGRVSVVACDLVEDPIETRADLAVARQCLQTLSREGIARAINNIGAALVPGGRFVIVGAILNDDRLSPPRARNYNLLALNYYDEGEAYLVSEYRDWLAAAGCDLELDDMDADDHLLIARKRAARRAR